MVITHVGHFLKYWKIKIKIGLEKSIFYTQMHAGILRDKTMEDKFTDNSKTVNKTTCSIYFNNYLILLVWNNQSGFIKCNMSLQETGFKNFEDHYYLQSKIYIIIIFLRKLCPVPFQNVCILIYYSEFWTMENWEFHTLYVRRLMNFHLFKELE